MLALPIRNGGALIAHAVIELSIPGLGYLVDPTGESGVDELITVGGVAVRNDDLRQREKQLETALGTAAADETLTVEDGRLTATGTYEGISFERIEPPVTGTRAAKTILPVGASAAPLKADDPGAELLVDAGVVGRVQPVSIRGVASDSVGCPRAGGLAVRTRPSQVGCLSGCPRVMLIKSLAGRTPRFCCTDLAITSGTRRHHCLTDSSRRHRRSTKNAKSHKKSL